MKQATLSPQSSSTPSPSRRILLVDDNVELIEFLVMLLEDRGYTTLATSSPVQAALLAQTERFDAVISDVRMPLLSGPEMIQSIRATRLNAQVPVVYISGQTNKEMSAIAHDPLAHYVGKPFGGILLLAALEDVLSCCHHID